MQYPAETFHLAKWRPITHADYVKMIGEIAHTELGTTDGNITTTLQSGETDSQYCLVTTAPVVIYESENSGPKVVHDAFLMIIFNPSSSKTLCFVRSDVHLVQF